MIGQNMEGFLQIHNLSLYFRSII